MSNELDDMDEAFEAAAHQLELEQRQQLIGEIDKMLEKLHRAREQIGETIVALYEMRAIAQGAKS